MAVQGYLGRNKGWNYRDLKEILHTHRLCTKVEEEPPEEAEAPESAGDGASEEEAGEEEEPRVTQEEPTPLKEEQALHQERQEQEKRVRELLPPSVGTAPAPAS